MYLPTVLEYTLTRVTCASAAAAVLHYAAIGGRVTGAVMPLYTVGELDNSKMDVLRLLVYLALVAGIAR